MANVFPVLLRQVAIDDPPKALVGARSIRNLPPPLYRSAHGLSEGLFDQITTRLEMEVEAAVR
ncbi:hypothetical protein [Bradyrhizobium sp. CCBAU 51627]|uniref:hypothetical protein n=1 Tax=Bradyrhizobium sp. CCBAU 51627 TaxID=1325088 RepID=UPI002305824B|nr:hypothetical protein [Bradyrhizobium sp. CCBAU 51627]